MIRSTFTLLLTLAAAKVCAQSLSEAAKQAEGQRKTMASAEEPKKYTSHDLPGPARIDSTLGTFVLSEDLYYGYVQAEVDLAKARYNADLDNWLMKWENDTRRDPFGMIDPYSRDQRVLNVLQKNRLTPRDFVFVRVALDRAKNDLGESKAQRAALPKPRVDNIIWVEKHPGALTPSPSIAQEERILESRRAGRQRK